MAAFKLLRTGDEPLIGVGDHIYVKGKQWDKSQANTVYKVVKSETTHFRVDHGIFSTSGANSKKTWTVDNILRADHSDVFIEVRLRIVGSATVYIRFPSGRVRGGLDIGAYTTVDLDNPQLRLLGGYTEKDTENYNLQFFEGYRHGIDFEIRNFLTDTKVVFDMVVNEMQIEPDPNWKGEVIEIEDDKEMRW